MKPIKFIHVFLLLLFASCSKPVEVTPPTIPHPQMQPFSLHEKAIRYGGTSLQIDANNDGRTDLVFGVQLVGDPLAKVDKRRFLVSADFYTSLPVTEDEQVKVLSKSEAIPLIDFNGSRWYNASSVILAERVQDLASNISWNGNWLQVSHQYLPFQVLRNNQRYNGWIELSVDKKAEQVVLHRGAISTEPEKAIKAGY
jgi:hypothetical protein